MEQEPLEGFVIVKLEKKKNPLSIRDDVWKGRGLIVESASKMLSKGQSIMFDTDKAKVFSDENQIKHAVVHEDDVLALIKP